jgi:hypothetical protein
MPSSLAIEDMDRSGSASSCGAYAQPAADDAAAHLETDEYRPLLIRDIRPGDLVR